jgi:hypothetical protein
MDFHKFFNGYTSRTDKNCLNKQKRERCYILEI